MSVKRPISSAATTLIAAALAAVLPSARARAQEPADTFALSQLVVTATRVPVPRAAVPAAVTVLQGDELRARGVRFVADALRDVPGATLVRTGSAGGVTSLFLRGGESDYVQVLVDGVVVNDPGGAFDFGQLTLDDVDRIEIVRGPVSVMYGSDAVTGVVHVITRRGSGRPRVRAAVSAGVGARSNGEASVCPGYPSTPCPSGADLGSYYERGLEASVAGGAGALHYSLGGSAYHTDGGYAYNNEYRNGAVAGQLGLARARGDATLSGRFTDGVFHYPTDGAGRLADRNQYRTSRSLALGLDGGGALAPWLELRGALSLHDGDYDTVDDPDSAADTLGFYASTNATGVQRRKADVHANLRAGRSVATGGFEVERQDGTSAFASRSDFGPFESSSDDERSNRAVYGQLFLVPVERLSATAGVRREDNDRFGGYTTWRAGAAARLGEWTELRGAAGTGFKEPTFFENYATGFTVGNPALQPERSRSWEIGLERRLSFASAALSATWFDQRFRNLIQYTSSPAPGQPNYVNIGAATAKGLELEASVGRADGVTVAASWVHLSTEVVDAGFGTDPLFQAGKSLIRRPQERVNASVAAPFGTRLRAGADVRWVGERDDLDFVADFNGARVTLPSYTLAAAFADVRVTAGGERELHLRARVENLLDRRYGEVVNFPSPGRSLSVALIAGAGL